MQKTAFFAGLYTPRRGAYLVLHFFVVDKVSFLKHPTVYANLYLTEPLYNERNKEFDQKQKKFLDPYSEAPVRSA